MWKFPATFLGFQRLSLSSPSASVGVRTAHQIHHGLLWTSGMGGYRWRFDGKIIFKSVFPCLSRLSNINFLATLRYSNMICCRIPHWSIPPFSSGISIAMFERGSHLRTGPCDLTMRIPSGMTIPKKHLFTTEAKEQNWPKWPLNLEISGVSALFLDLPSVAWQAAEVIEEIQTLDGPNRCSWCVHQEVH